MARLTSSPKTLRTSFLYLVGIVIPSQLRVVRTRKNKNLTKKDPPQPKYKNRAFNAYQQANAVLCLSASECCFMLISAFHAYQWEDMAFNAYRGVENNWNSIYSKRPFFRARSVRLEFFFPPNQIGYVLDLSVLFVGLVRNCPHPWLSLREWLYWLRVCQHSLSLQIVPVV